MKKILTGVMAVAFVALFAASALATTVHGIYRGRTIFEVSIQGNCTVGLNGTGSYGTDPARRVKGCSVYLLEGSYYDASTVEGNDPSQQGKVLYTRKLKKPNNWFQTARSWWDWSYFSN